MRHLYKNAHYLHNISLILLIVSGPVLGLAGMELILFIAAHKVLCFRFVTKTALITHRCPSCC